ncbi:hypothetical protein M0804_011470 [Polistes exclamans]|nr:hypothetical protein M0804_011470 [Polistes exclamans]
MATTGFGIGVEFDRGDGVGVGVGGGGGELRLACVYGGVGRWLLGFVGYGWVLGWLGVVMKEEGMKTKRKVGWVRLG